MSSLGILTLAFVLGVLGTRLFVAGEDDAIYKHNQVVKCMANLTLELKGHHVTFPKNFKVDRMYVDKLCDQFYPEFLTCLGEADVENYDDVKAVSAIKAMMAEICDTDRESHAIGLACIVNSSWVASCEVNLERSWVREINPNANSPIPWDDPAVNQCIMLKEYMVCIVDRTREACDNDISIFYTSVRRKALIPFKYYIQCDVYGPTGGVPGITAGSIVAVLFALIFTVFIWCRSKKSSEHDMS